MARKQALRHYIFDLESLTGQSQAHKLFKRRIVAKELVSAVPALCVYNVLNPVHHFTLWAMKYNLASHQLMMCMTDMAVTHLKLELAWPMVVGALSVPTTRCPAKIQQPTIGVLGDHQCTRIQAQQCLLRIAAQHAGLSYFLDLPWLDLCWKNDGACIQFLRWLFHRTHHKHCIQVNGIRWLSLSHSFDEFTQQFDWNVGKAATYNKLLDSWRKFSGMCGLEHER